MFWIVLSLFGLAFTFAKVGAMSVLVKVLTFALGAAFLVIAGLCVALIWRKIVTSRAR